MASVYLNIKDNFLQKGFAQLIAQAENFSLCDTAESAAVIISDHENAALPDVPVLTVGADDLPVCPRDVLLRAAALACAGGVYMIGADRFTAADKMIVTAAGENIALTDLETALLTFFAQRAGEGCSKETLLKEVWDYQQNVTTHTVETHIYRLRQKYPALENRLHTKENGYVLYLGPEDE